MPIAQKRLRSALDVVRSLEDALPRRNLGAIRRGTVESGAAGALVRLCFGTRSWAAQASRQGRLVEPMR